MEFHLIYFIPSSFNCSKVNSLGASNTEICPEAVAGKAIVSLTLPSPKITITKLASNNPLGFKIETATLPEIKLPDYKILAKNTPEGEAPRADEKDVEESIQAFRTQWARTEKYQKEKESALAKNEPIPSFENIVIPEEELPIFDDEFVKKLGNYTSLKDFKEKLKENILREKGVREKEMRRGKILEAIVEATSFDVPEILVESELRKRTAQLEHDVERSGMKLEDYLIKTNTTVESLQKEWQTHAEKHVKSQLVLNAIAKQENIAPERDVVEREVEHLLSHHKNADPGHARVHVETLLTNEKVLVFLETGAQETSEKKSGGKESGKAPESK